MKKATTKHAISILALLGFLLAVTFLPAAVGAEGMRPPNPCTFSLPSSHALRVLTASAGRGTIVRLAGNGYTFNLSRWAGFDAAVLRYTGIMPPAGDTVEPFSFGLPGGHYYVGLANLVELDGQEHVCLSGTAYYDLGNHSAADSVPPVAVNLDGMIGPARGRVDLLVRLPHSHWHYYVYGRPSLSNGNSTWV